MVIAVVYTFNAIEAGWWLLCAVLIATRGGRTQGMTPRLRLALALFLVGFALSDVIEMRTGA